MNGLAETIDTETENSSFEPYEIATFMSKMINMLAISCGTTSMIQLCKLSERVCTEPLLLLVCV